MELRQIRSFLSIAETLHFGRTAQLIHLSQPALSLQIRALEKEVGVRLLERNRRKTTLTPAGRAFRDAAAVGIAQLDRAIRNARLAADGKLGLLRIGFISTAGSELLPNIIRVFRESNPAVEFSLRNILTAEQIRMLEGGALDIGFLRLPIGGHTQLEVSTVHREPFVLVVPASHPLAKRKKMRLNEVSAGIPRSGLRHTPGCRHRSQRPPDGGRNAHAHLARRRGDGHLDSAHVSRQT
jgi:DNA-binding transcriptional LysR family regulator